MEINSASLLVQGVRLVAVCLPKLKRDLNDILADIRFIRFNDEGLLGAIDSMIDGRPIDRDAFVQRLTEFNDYEWRVADAVARLVEECGPVSRIAKEDLQLIAWRKPRIREDLQRIFNNYGRRGFRTEVQELQEIRKGIRDLNKAIDEVEDQIMRRINR